VACAQLAGVPEAVLARARTLLEQFESGQPLRPSRRQNVPQLDLFAQQAQKASLEHPVVQTLRNAKLEEMTPLEAIKFLDQLQKMLAT
jgi:DNA mismatch repair protein MutS